MTLFNTSTLTFTRTTAAAVLQADGTFTDSGSTTTFDISCSLQPYKLGIVTKKLPEGFGSSDSRMIYTKTLLKSVDQFTKLPADTTVIGGFVFEVHDVADFNQFSLSSDHFAVMLIRKDL